VIISLGIATKLFTIFERTMIPLTVEPTGVILLNTLDAVPVPPYVPADKPKKVPMVFVPVGIIRLGDTDIAGKPGNETGVVYPDGKAVGTG
jgi:hypothetical protein